MFDKIKKKHHELLLKSIAKLCCFNGRVRRSECWGFFLINVIFAFAFGFICGLLDVPNLANIYTLAVLLPGIAVGVRRMHDVGKSGWFILIPIYNLILACTEGDKGPNEYGEDPRQVCNNKVYNKKGQFTN